ncbi:MAG: oxidoreductase [Solibacillus sp.]
MGMRSALVVGATGLVGSALVKQLCESDEYAAVNVIARRALDFTDPKLVVKVRDFEQIGESDIEFAHEVFCCLGTTIKKAGSREQFEKVDVEYPLSIAALAKNRGIGHFIVISAMGANEKSFTYYNRVKGKLESELTAMDFPQLSIVRPSLLTGERDEFRLGENVGAKAMSVLNPLMVGPGKKFRSIEAQQVACAMMVIALHGKKQKVAVYSSDELSTMQMPKPEVDEGVDQDVQFNWGKLKSDDVPPIDKELPFNRQQHDEPMLDELVSFKRKQDDLPPIDEDIVFDRRKLKDLEVDRDK